MAKTTVQTPKSKPQTPKSGTTPASGVNAAELVRRNNRWRENYNPLRGLVISRAVALLECGERGDFADLMWLYRMVEKRFAVLRSLILRRRSALMKFDWDIKVMSTLPAGAKPELADKQRKFLRSRYELIGNLRQAIKFLALAEFRGFALLNKHRFEGGPNDGAVKELHWLPQWNIVRDGQFGDWYWNPEALSGATPQSLGEEKRIDPQECIIREVDMPVNEIALIAFIRSNLSQKDWDAFVEIFGLSGCVVIMPPGGAPAGKEDEYRSAAEKVAEGGSGALPNGSEAQFPAAGVRGNSPFKEHLEWQEKDVVLAGTGGKLAMLTAATGMNDSQGDNQEGAFQEVAQGEAKEISELFQQQFDLPELEAEFPNQPVCVYFEIAAQDEEDASAVVDRVQKLEGAGLQTDVNEVSEKVGLKLVRGPKPSVQPPVSSLESQVPAQRVLQNRTQRVLNSGRLSAAEAQLFFTSLAKDLQPLRERLARVLEIQDPTLLRQKLQEMLREYESLKVDILADPTTARALASISATEATQTLQETEAERAAAPTNNSNPQS